MSLFDDQDDDVVRKTGAGNTNATILHAAHAHSLTHTPSLPLCLRSSRRCSTASRPTPMPTRRTRSSSRQRRICSLTATGRQSCEKQRRRTQHRAERNQQLSAAARSRGLNLPLLLLLLPLQPLAASPRCWRARSRHSPHRLLQLSLPPPLSPLLPPQQRRSRSRSPSRPLRRLHLHALRAQQQSLQAQLQLLGLSRRVSHPSHPLLLLLLLPPPPTALGV